jgi:hypothetical protein
VGAATYYSCFRSLQKSMRGAHSYLQSDNELCNLASLELWSRQEIETRKAAAWSETPTRNQGDVDRNRHDQNSSSFICYSKKVSIIPEVMTGKDPVHVRPCP